MKTLFSHDLVMILFLRIGMGIRQKSSSPSQNATNANKTEPFCSKQRRLRARVNRVPRFRPAHRWDQTAHRKMASYFI